MEFFLGCKSMGGFLSLFSQLQNPADIQRLYIMKGGPGSGKSTLMRKLGADMANLGHTVEWVPCASDPKSLDAVIDRTTGLAILDGTAPHIVDPKHPGAVETVVNAAQAWEEAGLVRGRGEIVDLTGQIDFCHSRASAYIRAAGTLLEHNRAGAQAFVDPKAVGYWTDLISSHLQPGSGGEDERLLSAVSVGKLTFLPGTLRALCNTVYTAHDEWGAASGQLLARLRERALERGTRVITCWCSVRGRGKIDHLIFPDDRVGVSTVNAFHAVTHPGEVCVQSLSRPLAQTLQAPFAQAAQDAKALLEQARAHVARGKQLHDELEHCYVRTMDFAVMDGLYETLKAAFMEKARD